MQLWGLLQTLLLVVEINSGLAAGPGRPPAHCSDIQYVMVTPWQPSLWPCLLLLWMFDGVSTVQRGVGGACREEDGGTAINGNIINIQYSAADSDLFMVRMHHHSETVGRC